MNSGETLIILPRASITIHNSQKNDHLRNKDAFGTLFDILPSSLSFPITLQANHLHFLLFSFLFSPLLFFPLLLKCKYCWTVKPTANHRRYHNERPWP